MSLPNLDLSDAARTETSTDRSGFTPDTLPMGVVRASSVDDVVETLRYAHAQGIPVVTRGAGSGLAGGSSAHEGELVLDVSGMNRILSLDPQEQIIVVEPGILNAEVDDAARLHGLFYAPDPASMTYCSIGGNIATNAGGMRCAKYGVTKDSVLGLTVVLADGSILKTGGQTMKRVSGYDLTSLFIGSEGTLGVVVEATLRLRPRSETTGMFVAYFADIVAAASAAAAVTSSGIQPTALELVDGKTLDAIDEALGTEHGSMGRAFLLVQTDGLGAHQEIEQLERLVRQFTDSVRVAQDSTEADHLMTARREAIPSIEMRGTIYVGDLGVPRKHLAEIAQRLEAIGIAHGVDLYTIAHAGDGNFHPILIIPDDQTIDSGSPKAALDDMFWAAHELGGTLTGEHGVGLLKRDWLVPELGEQALELCRQIKQVFDPKGILNPGKAI